MRAEIAKLKYAPIIWLSGIVSFISITLVLVAHILDVHNAVSLGRNPWNRLFNSGIDVYKLFMSIPFIVLFISTVFYLERQNHGFKQLYALPFTRTRLLFDKLSAVILYIVTTITIILIGLFLSGYVLNFIYPEYEFDYYSLPVLGMLRSAGLAFLSVLGVIGIQYFLSLRFKGFLIPASIGILCYVIGFILSTANNTISLYFPYCYPFISRKNSMMTNDAIELIQIGIINQIELYSLLIFLVFIGLSLITERRRNL